MPLANVPPPRSGVGAADELLLEIHLPPQVVAPFEVAEAGKPCREFLVPVAIVNRFGPPAALTPEEEADAVRAWLDAWPSMGETAR